MATWVPWCDVVERPTMGMTKSLAVFALSACLLAPVRASACGGCFHPVTTPSAVTGHRMAFAISETRTVLWDQFQYAGAPEDFSWVLPVRPGSYLEESTDAWFEALDAVTQVRVTSPELNCAEAAGDGGCGCASSAESASLDRGGSLANDDVTVVHEGTVGPYQTVTLRSENPDALTNWLNENGYVIPADIEPVIEAYVSEGYDFVALQLRPGQGVRQMTPVRVITPGGEGRLPLRMVAAGVGESVDIVLYVITESRSQMPDLHEVSVSEADLVWDFGTSSSNYLELRRQALARNLGYSYLTAFAEEQAFTAEYFDRTGFPIQYVVTSQGRSATFSNFWSLYFGQARANDNLTSTEQRPACPNLDAPLKSAELVVEDPDADGLPASTFVCDAYSDIAAAMIGMHPANVWTTRLELKLPKEALSMDCVVEPAASQEPKSQLLDAEQKKNPPCTESAFESRIAPGGRIRTPMVGLLLAALVFLRRRVRRAERA
jgi:hypothetical protein